MYYDGEKIFKGAANHRRLEALVLLSNHPGLSTDEIVEKLKINYQTGAGHIQKLVHSGLAIAYREANLSRHKLSSIGMGIIKLLIKQ